VQVRRLSGEPVPGLLHQLRGDGDDVWLFLCNTDGNAAAPAQDVCLRISGHWAVQLYDTHSGAIHDLDVDQDSDGSLLTWQMHPQGSLLLRLLPTQPQDRPPAPAQVIGRSQWRSFSELEGPVPVRLHEPNVLPLDRFAWRLDNGPWQEPMELLRINNAARAALGWEPIGGSGSQPWTLPAEGASEHSLELRCELRSELDLTGLKMSLEGPEHWSVSVDGQALATIPEGWWVDEDFHTIPVGNLSAGSHQLYCGAQPPSHCGGSLSPR
jgi:hypothetical protein